MFACLFLFVHDCTIPRLAAAGVLYTILCTHPSIASSVLRLCYVDGVQRCDGNDEKKGKYFLPWGVISRVPLRYSVKRIR